MTPEAHATRACHLQQAGSYAEAAAEWRAAKAASIGHARRDRYHDAAEWCERQAIPHPDDEFAG